MKTPFRNIYVRQQTAVENTAPKHEADARLPRERLVTNDPAREFAARPGAVRALPDEIAAIILARQEHREVTREGVTVDGRKFWHENSITCATKAGTKEKVLVTYNRYKPEIIHVLTNDGAYVESIPEKGKAEFFDPATTQKQLGAVRRDQARAMDRMKELHGPDTLETLQRERENLARMQRCVSTFESPVPPDQSADQSLSRTNPARRIATAEKSMSRAITRDKKQKARHSRTIEREGEAALRDLLSPPNPEQSTESNAGDDLLKILAGNAAA